MKNLLNNIEEMYDFVSAIDTSKLDPLNHFQTSQTRNILYLLMEVKKEFNEKGISFEINNVKDFFIFILVNLFDQEFYEEKELPAYLEDYSCLVVSLPLRTLFKNIFNFFAPQNKREISLMQECIVDLDYTEMETLFVAVSTEVDIKLPTNNILKQIYLYNKKNNSYSIQYFSNFICFVNLFYKDKYPVYDSIINPENGRQHVILKEYLGEK